ncbi:MAG: hypothetical protein HUU10_03625, partial [Bacteroidetes bacterium]|nr:hypothetical protein [Bacteroidota bacterium]
GNNTVLDDIGYFFGGMTNLSEGIQYIDSKTGWESTWWDEVDELAKNNKPGDSVNPTTLKQNILNENYPGGDNPKSIEGHDWWGRIKGDTFVDLPAQLHDAAWTRMGLHADKYGITLATTTTSYLADWRFVGQNLYLATKHVRSSPLLSMKAYSIGIGFAAIIYPKSVLIGRNAENRL